jgi:phage baseplate assembly protein W
MARPPISPPHASLTRTLGSGWYFPVAQENAPRRHARLAMASDDLNVRQSIEIILATSKGERAMRPDFGCDLNRLLFGPNTATTQALAAFEVTQALKSWEPRIELLDVDAQPGGDDGGLLLINVEYRVRSTDNRFNLVFPFYLNRALT